MLNYIIREGYSQYCKELMKTDWWSKNNTLNLITIFVAILVIVSLFVDFWLFCWSMNILFHFPIAYNFINWLAYTILLGSIKAVTMEKK